jgi:hypothetical protein
MACGFADDSYYVIDSVWTSERKALKRQEELNKNGVDGIIENRGCGLFDICTEVISH